MSKNPFILVPWQHDFMQAVVDTALEECSDLSQSLFIFPHSRPARYLERIIREDTRIKKPVLMPQCLTVSQLFKTIFDESHLPATPAGALDRVGVLLNCLREEQIEHPGMIDNIPTDDAKAFFPWGIRIAGIFEEFLNYRRIPENFIHLEDELLPFAVAILSRLSSLYKRYITALNADGWTTPGLVANKAIEALESGHESNFLNTKKNIYLCGFYSLSTTEDTLFKELWSKKNAKVLVHADPKLETDKFHWSCTALKKWTKAWETSFTPSLTQQMSHETKIKYFSGYDVHSQLAFLRSSIHQQSNKNKNQLEDTAIILPDTSLLLPVLHHIQADDVNISMGYPLNNTALQRFLDAILSMHQNKREGFYWRDCINFLRQPYIKMLSTTQDAEGRTPWRELLLKAEHRLRTGRRYVDLQSVITECLTEFTESECAEDLKNTWATVYDRCIYSWHNLHSLSEMGNLLGQIIDLLLEKGGHIWPHFPIDAECLSRFAQSIVPELKNSTLAHEQFPQHTIFAIFHELAKAERVPFDAYPLTALQIMGLLESRLLSFKNVFILDATDNILPGSIQHDPLLPDSLRNELGLPDSARRQRLTAYYFFRLLKSAENVHIFWQEGIEPQGVLDDKKLKSRFVEELLWNEEQKRKCILNPNVYVPASRPELPSLLQDGPLFQIGSHVNPVVAINRNINADNAAKKRLKKVLSSPISATRLNRYIGCPAAFYYHELADVRPTQEVNEEENPALIGNLFHNVLKNYYSHYLGRPINSASLNKHDLIKIYKDTMHESLPIDDMPADAKLMLGIAGERRLHSYLKNQPEETVIKALEMSVTAPLSVENGKTFQLIGYLDRVDERIQCNGEPGLVILDYKTGRVNTLSPDIWLKDEFWSRLENKEYDLRDNEFFSDFSDNLPDVQLPLYLYLTAFGQTASNDGGLLVKDIQLSSACNAGWVNLREKGEEIFLFPEEFSMELRSEIIDNKISLALEYLLCHLYHAESFSPRPSNHCDYCEYKDICIVLS